MVLRCPAFRSQFKVSDLAHWNDTVADLFRGTAIEPLMRAVLLSCTTATWANAITCKTPILTPCGQFLGSGKRLETESITTGSSGKTVFPGLPEEHHNILIDKRS